MKGEVFKNRDWLHKHISDTDLVILDATIPKVGQKIDLNEKVSGIPGARIMDLKNDFSNRESPFPNTVPGPELFEEAARKLGINNHSKIIVYDRHGIYSAPRAWYLFRAMGKNNVYILDGGLPAWIESGGKTITLHPYKGSSGDFTAVPDQDKWVDYQFVLDNIGNKNMQIIDARSEGRFYGKEPEPRKGLRGGHIPSSTNIPTSKLLNRGKLKGDIDLEETFLNAKAENKALIFTCGSGITACVLAAAAEHVGFKDLKVFDGSWTEWAMREELPISK